MTIRTEEGAQAPVSILGAPLGRVEGREKVTGATRYTADVPVSGLLTGAVLRSPYPHARITRVDASAARRVKGVRAVLSGQDVGEVLFGRAIADIPVLAVDRVRYTGEPVAAVAAEDREALEEALRLITVEYEELPAVFDPFQAMQPDAPILHPRFREYERGVHWGSFAAGQDIELPEIPNICSHELRSKGDVEQGLREAEVVLEHTYRTGIQHQGYLEPHTCVAWARPDGTFQLWASNKAPFTLRTHLARDLDLPEEGIAVEPMYVGGDFGGKGSPMLIPLSYYLSRAAGGPVRTILSWPEEFQAANPRHAAWITIRTGVTRDGTLVARDVKAIFDSGAYAGYKPIPHARLWASHLAQGAYRVPHFRFEAQIYYTNHLPAGHMRSPGGAQVAFACEAEIDRVAEEIGIDPFEFRRRNGVEEGDLSALGERWTGIRLKECLRAVKEASDWGRPRPRNVGRGISVCQDVAGWGGSSSIVKVHADGTATLVTSVNDQGSGAHTILTQIVAHELQLPVERVRVEFTGTSGPWDRGSSAMSVTHVAGQATVRASVELRDKLAAYAADYLGCAPEQVELVNRVFRDRRRPESGLPFAEVAARAGAGGEPVTAFYRYEHWEVPTATSFIAQVVDVEVDPETGNFQVRRVIQAADVGTVLNPIGVTGQLEGGLVMGMGFAKSEEVRVADGRVETMGHHDYKLPSIADIPDSQTILITTGEGQGPYGAKAVAELGHVPMPAAIANAIHDATGVRINELPISAERVHAALQAARARKTSFQES